MSHSYGAVGATSAAPVQLYLDIPTPSWQGVGNGKPVPVDFEIGRFAVDEISVRFRQTVIIYRHTTPEREGLS